VLGTVGFGACDSHPQAPTSLGLSQATRQPRDRLDKPGQLPTHRFVSTLTLDIGSGCAVVPEAERTRKYTATIDYADRGLYVVTLSDGTFLTGPIGTAGSRHFSGIGCHQFFVSEDIDIVQYHLPHNDDGAHGGHIVEQLASGPWLEIIGFAEGKLDLSSMEASGTSNVWSCRTPSSDPFSPQSRQLRFQGHRLTLTRKH
jgi:hypothetical protein